MTSYTRQSTFIPNDVIKAEHGNDEFNQLVAAFAQATGHTHSGAAAEGAYIPLISDTDNTDKVEIVTGGAKTTGTHQVTGVITADVGLTATTGDITATAGDVVATAGDVVLTTGNVTLAALATVDGRDISVDGTKLDGIEALATADQSNAEIKTAYEANADTNEFSDAEQTKLAGIEAAATADQTGAEIKTAYELEANTNAFTDAEQTKLTGIETAATADQTNAEIKTAYEANSNTNAFTDAEQTKLTGIETSAKDDQTAAEVVFTPGSGVVATDVQAAIEEVVIRRNHISGLQTSQHTDADHDIQTSVGECNDSTNIQLLKSSSILIKQIDAVWAVGTAAGGLASALTLSVSTWYHFFIIAKTDGTVDFGWDTSLTATNLLTDAVGYTLFRRIASHITDASANIIGFTQISDEFRWDEMPRETSVANPGTSAVSVTVDTPIGVTVDADMMFSINDSTTAATTFGLLTSTSQTDTAPSSSLYDVAIQNGSDAYSVVSKRILEANSTIRFRISNSDAGVIVRLFTVGYTDYRGNQ